MSDTHGGHGHMAHDHGAMIADYRRRFWVSLVLTVPVLALSPMIQSFLGIREILSFPGSDYLLNNDEVNAGGVFGKDAPFS